MRWTLKTEVDSKKVALLASALQVDTLIAKLLVQRGVETFDDARKFFRPTLDDLHDPYLMKDMDKAVDRIEQAIERQENILIYGDYDVDGTTAVALVSSYLRSYYPNVATYIPDRYKEGYGVSYLGIDFAADNDISLIIALDCGIKSIDHISYATSKRIDFIICDHHRPGDEIPAAVAVLDPKRSDCSYPYDELCGCGIGFKLIQALGGKRGEKTEDLISYLDLVATAIAADIVPMTGENRVLAKFGLDVINTAPRPGIKALREKSKKKILDITDIVFIISPRINAAGRIKHGNEAVALLTEFDDEQASAFAREIETYNSERKLLDKGITSEALEQISDNLEQDKFSTVVFNEQWHKGVIGIVASRLIETYYRPTLVFTKSGEFYAASARSVKGFDVYNAIDACAQYVEQFGGHMYAAGLTLKAENYSGFKKAFEEHVERHIAPAMRIREVEIDAVIQFEDITPKLRRLLKQFEPYGPLNMMPVFKSENVCCAETPKTIGENKTHLRLILHQDGYPAISCIGFGLADKLTRVEDAKLFDIAYTLSENEWNGVVSLQLVLKDLQ